MRGGERDRERVAREGVCVRERETERARERQREVEKPRPLK